jgi:hypothetical protein
VAPGWQPCPTLALKRTCAHVACAAAGAFLALLPPLGFLLPPAAQAAIEDPDMKAAVALVRAHTHFCTPARVCRGRIESSSHTAQVI